MTFEDFVTRATVGFFLAVLLIFGVMFFQQVNHCVSGGGAYTSDGHCLKKESLIGV